MMIFIPKFIKIEQGEKMNTIENTSAKALNSQEKYKIHDAVIHCLYFAVSLLLSQTSVMGELSPFGAAVCASCKPKYLISTAAGAFIGSFFVGDSISPYRRMAAVIIASMINLAMRFIGRGFKKPFACSASAFFSIGVPALVVSISQGAAMTETALYIAESIIGAGSAYFFARTFNEFDFSIHLKAMTISELCTLAITGTLFLSSLACIEINGFVPVRMIAVFIILIAARYIGALGGAVISTALGMGMGMVSNSIYLCGAYSFAGLMAGIFSPFGQLGSAAAFALSSGVMIAFSGGGTDIVQPMIEIGIAASAFVLMPRKAGNAIDKYINSKIDVSPSDTLRTSLVSKLRFAASAMERVSQNVESVNHKLKEMAQPDYSVIARTVCRNVCSGCEKKGECWKGDSAAVLNAFNSLLSVTRRDGKITDENLPGYFQSDCMKSEEIKAQYNEKYTSVCQSELFQNSVDNLREIIADQFYGISDMLFDLSAEFERAEVFDADTAQKVKKVLLSFGVNVSNVTCIVDKFGRMRLEVSCIQPLPDMNDRNISKELSKVCSRDFDDVNITLAGKSAMLSYCEKAKFSVLTGVAQYTCKGNTLCGDCVERLGDGKGHEIIIISDGMGHGGHAAVDGAMASSLIARLVKAGFGFDCALRVVNSALLIKSSDESLATLDIVCVDLFTGKVNFYKAGASSSFVLKENKAVKVELPSLPAGILRQVEFARAATFLEEDDKIVLFSDGVADSDTRWLKETIENDKTSTPTELAERILSVASSRRGNQPDDDMTVVVAQIVNN